MLSTPAYGTAPGTRPKVVMQIVSTDGIYGAERVVLSLAAHLARKGWDSRVVAIDCPGARALLELAAAAGLKTHTIRAAGRPIWQTLRDLRGYVAEQKVDVVHAHGYKADTLVHWARIRQYARTFSTCHTWYSDSLRMKFYEFLDKRALRHFGHVAVVSPQLHEEVATCGVPPERISLIVNGTEHRTVAGDARPRIRAELEFDDGDFVIARVGRLAASKGNDLLLRALAAAKLPATVKLLFVGEGEERQALDLLSAQSGLQSRVSFTGYRSDIPELLAASDLFAQPSIKEGLPIALLEAMAAGLPIVSTDAGATGIAIQDGRNAWVVPAGDEPALARALREAVADPRHRRELAAVAQADFLEKFSADAMGAAYEARYAALLHAPAGVAVHPPQEAELRGY